MTGIDDDDSSSEGSETRLWPLPRRHHSFDVVQEKWLVVFGGLEESGSSGELANPESPPSARLPLTLSSFSGESDIWVYDLELSVWHHPELGGWNPRPVFLHSSVNHKDDVFVFGKSNFLVDVSSYHSCLHSISLFFAQVECRRITRSSRPFLDASRLLKIES